MKKIEIPGYTVKGQQSWDLNFDLVVSYPGLISFYTKCTLQNHD